jgi:hypothetical protein
MDTQQTAKDNILKEIESLMINPSDKKHSHIQSNYIRALCLLTKNKTDFLAIYYTYLSIPHAPLLRVEEALALYPLLVRNPNAIHLMRKFSELLKGRKTSDVVWSELLRFLFSYHAKSLDVVSRLRVFTLLIKTGLVEKYAGREKYLIRNFMKLYYAQKVRYVSDKQIKMKLGLYIHWAHQIADFNKEVGQRFLHFAFKHLQYSTDVYEFEWSPEKEKFIKRLESLLPDFYLMENFTSKELNRLFAFYSLKPDIFFTHSPRKEELTKAAFLLEPFFSNFRVPQFIFTHAHLAANTDDVRSLELFKHVLSGKSVKSFPHLPVRIGKAETRLLFTLEPYSKDSVWGVFVMARFMNNGVPREEAELFCRNIHTLPETEFWINLLSGLYKIYPVGNRLLGVIAYLTESSPAEWKALRLNEQTLNKILRDTRNWLTNKWSSSIEMKNLPAWNVTPLDKDAGDRRICIRQIKNSVELHREGVLLNHCVYTYLQACLTSRFGIFSLRVIKRGIEEPAVTIQVDKDLSIVQAKGRHNRLPTPTELEIIREWARINSLKMNIAA